MELNIGSEISGVWILPAALQQLEECGETDLVDELLAIFQTDTASRLEVLARAVRDADHRTARQEAHTIKGSALQVGALRVADICLQLEAEACKPVPEGMPAMFDALLRKFDEVREVIAARRAPASQGSPRHGQ